MKRNAVPLVAPGSHYTFPRVAHVSTGHPEMKHRCFKIQNGFSVSQFIDKEPIEGSNHDLKLTALPPPSA